MPERRIGPYSYVAFVKQGGVEVARVMSARDPGRVEAEINRYAEQYAEDGPVEIWRSAALLAWLAGSADA